MPELNSAIDTIMGQCIRDAHLEDRRKLVRQDSMSYRR